MPGDRPKLYFIACCFPPFGRGNSLTNACVANYLVEYFDTSGNPLKTLEVREIQEVLYGNAKVPSL